MISLSAKDHERLNSICEQHGVRLLVVSGLRNRLAHEYNEIEPAKVQDAVRTAITQVPQYLEAV